MKTIILVYFTVVCPNSTFEGHRAFESKTEAIEFAESIKREPLEDPSNKDPKQCGLYHPIIKRGAE